MKVLPFTIPKPENVTLYTEHYKGESFYEKLHQHKEIQISLVVAGEGTFVIGDCVGDFKPNDIFVIGENLPHVFRSNPSKIGSASSLLGLSYRDVVLIQFKN